MAKKTILILCLFSLSFCASASFIDDTKSKLRPFLSKFLSKEWTDKILGPSAVKNEITLPPIPKVERNATSLEVYENNNDDLEKNKKQLTEEEQANFNYRFINELFFATRNSKPSKSDVNKWMNVMGQGATREGVYRALVLDNFYGGLENYTNTPSETAIEFTVYYMGQFLGQSIKVELLQEVNIYTLKRETVERTLELIDVLSKKPDHLYRWYAVFAGELADRYSHVWKSKIRKETSMQRHKQWAQAVPSQHLKSEVIIKLHKVYNSFMSN